MSNQNGDNPMFERWLHDRLMRTIENCKSVSQLEVAKKYLMLAVKKYPTNQFYSNIFEAFTAKKWQLSKKN